VSLDDQILSVYHEVLDDFYRVMSRRCDGDRDLTEDVVQETWLRAVKAWRADGLPDKPLAWLVTVATRLLSNTRRRREAIDIDTVDPAAPAPRNDAPRTILERAMAALPALQRHLLEAFHFEDRRVAEIALTEGLSERAVEGRLRRARQALRKQIETDPASREILP
jgi:RNA polymerase sigma-70 factor (ECF subfamily)